MNPAQYPPSMPTRYGILFKNCYQILWDKLNNISNPLQNNTHKRHDVSRQTLPSIYGYTIQLQHSQPIKAANSKIQCIRRRCINSGIFS